VEGEATVPTWFLLAEGRFVTSNLRRGIALALTVLVAGCGRSIPPTYPVTGKVVYTKDKPVTYGRVEFQSTSNPELRATGRIQTDGTFSLTTNWRGESAAGAVVGEHKVLIELESRSALVILPAPYTVRPEKNEVAFEIPTRR
jgi:hypothetical protein